MKKDIEIPLAENVYLVAINEWDAEFLGKNWNVYLINDRPTPIENVIAVSTGYEGNRKTSTLRHALADIPAKTYKKVELLQEDLLAFNNEFFVTFFYNNRLYEKRFVFTKNTILESNYRPVPLMDMEGVLAD